MTSIWDCEEPVTKYADIEVPAWIEQDICPYEVAAIVQGGCASGAYMPAVTYHKALATMQEHGDDVLQYIEDQLGELPSVEGQSWSQMACTYLSAAVELWAGSIEAELEEAIDQLDE